MTFTAQTLGELRNLPSTLDDTIRITDAMGRPVKLHLDYSKGEGGVLIASHLSTDYGQMKVRLDEIRNLLLHVHPGEHYVESAVNLLASIQKALK